MKPNRPRVGAPFESGTPNSAPYKGAAAGAASVVSTLRQALHHTGLWNGAKTLANMNQSSGFDCPGCAWPDPDERSRFEFCENGAKAVLDEATREHIGADFFAQWSVADLRRQSDAWLNAQGRISQPMYLEEGASHYVPIEWQQAFELLGATLQRLASPQRAVFYTSGRASNEAAFLYQLFVRMYGCNNLPDCSNMCHESSGVALKETIGVGKGTVQLADFAQAQAIFVLGQNPGSNHPRMLSALRDAKLRGCKIVTINPLREAGLVRFKHPQKPADLLGDGVAISDLYLRVRVNGDVAALKGIMKHMLEQEEQHPDSVLDHDFIQRHTCGFEQFRQELRAVSWEEIVAQSGLKKEPLAKAAHIAMTSQATICCWAMGLTQHKNAVANIQEVVNFLLLQGNLGKPGAGACPVRGHSNVQGDRTMGISERMPKAFLQALGTTFGFEPPYAPGLDTVGAISAMHRGEVDVFFALGGNFLSACPDTEYTGEALQRCRLTAHVSTKLNRSHLVTGKRGLILPCLARSERDVQAKGEQFVTVENSMGIVHASRGRRAPASGHLRSEVAIVAAMAQATLGHRYQVNWSAMVDNYDVIREAIEKVVDGFASFNARVRQPGGFALPNPVRQRRFPTGSGKAHFTVHGVPRWELQPGEYLLMTIRSHDQFNTTIYTANDRYRGVSAHRRVLLMNPRDMADTGLRATDLVDVVSHFAGSQRLAPHFSVIPYDVPQGCVAAYFPEANALVPIDSYADKSRTPTSKSVRVTLIPAEHARGA